MHLRLGAALAVIFGLLALISSGRALAIGDILPNQQGMPDLDARAGSIAPSSAQQQIVSGLGAHATWNQFGTPKSLIKYGGYLATGLSSDPVVAAKTFTTNNEALFRLSDQGVANLQLLNDSPMVGSDGHAVLFRQTFSGLPATQDGLITVGVVDGKVAYASSSSAGDGNAPPPATISPQTAWTLAAANVGHPFSVVNLSAGKNINGWLTFAAPGLTDYQRVRLTALPTPTQGVRPAYESIVLDNQSNGDAQAYTEFVDAVTGKVWLRHNDVQQFADSGKSTASATSAAAAAATQTCDSTGHVCEFDGTMPGTTPADCSVNGPFTAPANTQTVAVTSSADVAANDIILYLDVGTLGNGTGGSSDEGTSPEAVSYAPTGGVPLGLPEYRQQDRVLLAPLAEQPVAGGLELPVRSEQHRLARAVGRRSAYRRHDRHDDGQQRHDRRSVGQPADCGRRTPAADAGQSGVSRAVGEHVVQLHEPLGYPRSEGVLSDGAHAGRKRHPRGRDEPVRRPQPHARLLLLPRLHRDELQRPALQLREHLAGSAKRPRRGRRGGRSGDRRRSVVRGA